MSQTAALPLADSAIDDDIDMHSIRQAELFEELQRRREEEDLAAALRASLAADAAFGLGDAAGMQPAGQHAEDDQQQQREQHQQRELQQEDQAEFIPAAGVAPPIPVGPDLMALQLSEEEQLRILLSGEDPDEAILR
jgi:hypothetical protein